VIYGIGVDLVETPRIERLLALYGERFARRVLTELEWPGYQRSNKPVLFVANRFAAKEAFSKAMGTGFRYPVTLQNISVVQNKAGKPGYVPHEWADVGDAVRWIRAAGGTAILAHPGRYPFGSVVLRELLQLFKEAGGAALEVLTSAHDAGDVRRFAALAQEYELLASHGSDFHDPNFEPFGPGSIGAMPLQCEPVWRHWPALAQ